MTLKQYSIFLAILAVVYSQHCETKTEYALLFPTVNEKMKWSIPNNFMTGLDMTYELPNQQIFGIKNSLYEVDNGVLFKQTATIVDIDSYKQPVNGAWLNGHAILDVRTGSSNILWAQSSVIATSESPKFNAVTPVFSSKPGFICFTLSYIDQETVLVDCADTSKDILSNYFYIVYKNVLQTPIQLPNSNLQNLKSATTGKRLMQQRIIVNTDTGKTTKYFFRGVPSWASPETLGNSLIEVFALDSSNQPYKINSYLDSATLAILVGTTKSYSFDLVDLQIDGDGHIFVLDAFNGLYILEWTADGIWHLVSHIPSKGGKAYALAQNMQITLYGDFVHHCAILYYDYFVLYELDDSGLATEKLVYDLQFQIGDFTDKFFFGINQKKILVENDKTLYLYTIDGVDLVTQITLTRDIQKIILNPYEPNFITFTVDSAQAYQISDSYLELLQNSQPATRNSMILKGTSHLGTATKDCFVSIEYEVLSETDANVYNVQKNDYTPFPDLMVYPSKIAYTLTDWVSGPIVNFSNQDQKVEEATFLGLNDDPVPPTVTVKPFELLDLALTATSFPDPAKVIYADILTKDSDPNLFYLFVQTIDLKINLWTCQTEDTLIPTGRLNCESALELGSSTLKLTKQTYQNWFFTDQITFAFLKDDYTLEIYTTDDGKPPVLAFHLAFSADPVNKIDSFAFVKNFLYIVQQSQKVIRIYKTLDDFPLMLTIDTNMIYQQGFTGEWKPRNVFGNKGLKPTLIFIDNAANMIIADYHDGELTLLASIDYKQQNSDARVSIGRTTFLIAEVGSDGSQINEYDYQDINNIVWLKKVSLYNKFTISSPLYTDFSDDNGYFFVSTQYNQKPAILVIQPGEMQHNSLFQYIQVATTSDSIIREFQQLREIQFNSNDANGIFAVGGDEQMFVYYNQGGANKFYQLFKTQRLAIIPSPKSNEFVSEVTIKLQATSVAGGTPLKFQDQTITVLNTMSNVEFDSDAFNKNAEILKVSKKEQFLDLDDTWFTGQVSSFSIDCTDCGKYIFMANKVNLTQSLIGQRSVVDIADFSYYQQSLVQTNDAVFFLNSNFQLAQAPVFLHINSDTFECYKVAAHAEGVYVVTICAIEGSNYAYITSCIGEGQCFPLQQTVILEGVAEVIRIEIIENTLLLLDDNNVLKAYTIDFNTWTATNVLTIDTTALKSQTAVVISDFTVETIVLTDSKLYKLFLTDLNTGIWMVDLSFTAGQLTMNSKVSTWKLSEWLSKVKQYSYEDTTYLSVKVYDHAVFDTALLNISVIFTTNNVAHYGVKLSFDFSNQKGGSVLVNEQLAYIINRYGNWDATVGLYAQGSYFGIPYQEEQVTFIAIYKIPATKLTLGDDPAAPVLITMLGGDDIGTQDASFFMLYSGADTPPALFVGQETGASGYSVNDKARIQILGGDNIKTQKITVTAKNDFSQASASPNIAGYSSDDSGSSSKWWLWLLIVIGALLVIGIIGYCIYKSKNKVKDEPLIVNQGQ